MSNAYLLANSGGSGPIPPTVPTSFITDVYDNTTAGPGTAIPAGNSLTVSGAQTNQNNDNGIRTDANPQNGNILAIEMTNRQTGTLTTTDNTLTTIISFPLGAVPSTFYIFGNVQAFNASTPSSAAYSFSAGYRTDGATATELGKEFHDTFQDPALMATDIFLNTSGNNVLLQVQGVALNIHWNSILEYRQVN